MTQLKAYKGFGAPDVTLLDVYICEDGFMSNNIFPTKELTDVIIEKKTELAKEGFGYQLLPFEHEKEGEYDVGLLAFRSTTSMTKITADVLSSKNFGHRQPFSRLVDDIDKFFEQLGKRPRKHLNQIVYCKNCRQLQLINMKIEYECTNCKDNLIAQT